MRRALALGLVVLLIVQAACATAKIVRRDAVDIEAQIVGADAQAVYVVDDQERTFAVPRRTIADIDHPGNAWMVGSAPLLASAAVLVGVALAADCRDQVCGLLDVILVVGALLSGGAGVAGFTVGYSQWARSVARAEPEAGAPEWLRGKGTAAAPPAPGTVPPIAEPAGPLPAAPAARP